MIPDESTFPGSQAEWHPVNDTIFSFAKENVGLSVLIKGLLMQDKGRIHHGMITIRYGNHKEFIALTC